MESSMLTLNESVLRTLPASMAMATAVSTAGKVMGLMVACNGSELRENFIGSDTVPSGPKDRGWIDAGLFGSLLLGDLE